MFENSKTIVSESTSKVSPVIYFRDLNIIYPLRRAVLNICANGPYKVYVGKDKAGEGKGGGSGNCQYESYDITNLVAESDFLYICVFSDSAVKESGTLTAQIDCEFAGDLYGTIVSDENWTTCTVPVTNAEIEGGNIFDFTRLSDFTGKVKIV